MGQFTEAMEKFRTATEDAARQEASIHEHYAEKILAENGIAYKNWQEHFDSLEEAIETSGYKLFHMIELGKDDAEVHIWKLFKLVDHSDRYQIKRVIAVEEGKE